MNQEVRDYLSKIGRNGGRISRRRLSSNKAYSMLKIREARRAFKNFKTSCFWSAKSDTVINQTDIAWVIDSLMRYGDRKAWEVADKLRLYDKLENQNAPN